MRDWKRTPPETARPAAALRAAAQARRAALAAALASLALAACTGTYGYSPAPDALTRAPRANADLSRVVHVRQIMFWEKDPALREPAGYLETREVWTKGALDPVTQYFVFDLNQRSPFGFISDVGVTHVWKGGGEYGPGRWESIGAFTLEGAAKALFKRPLKTNCAFDPLEYAPPTE